MTTHCQQNNVHISNETETTVQTLINDFSRYNLPYTDKKMKNKKEE